MALPKIAESSYVSETLASGKKVKIRPFNGREEKQILTAKLTNDKLEQYDTIVSVLNAITNCDVDKLSVVDFESLYVSAYSISVSDKIDAGFHCSNEECDNTIKVSIPIANIDMPKDNKPKTKIELSNDAEGNAITMVLNRVSVETARKILEAEAEEKDILAIYESLDGVYVGDEASEGFDYEEFKAWLLDQRSAYSSAVKAIRQSPEMSYTQDWKCPKCDHENHVEVRGFANFFSSSRRTLI